MPLDALLGTWAITMHHHQMPEPVHGQQRFERILDDTSMHYFDVRGVTRTFDLSLDASAWTIVRRGDDFWQWATTRFDGPDAMRGIGENSHDQGRTWEYDYDLDYRCLA